MSQGKPDPKSEDFEKWLTQFNIFATVLTRAQPKQAVKLFHYLEYIRTLRKNGQDWAKYDQLFRRLHERFPKRYPFHRQVHSLLPQCQLGQANVTANNVKPKASATVTSGSVYPAALYHSSAATKNAPYRPDTTPDFKYTFPTGTCWKFQRGEACPGCNWQDGHRCCVPDCGGSHPASRCTKFHSSSSSSTSTSTNTSNRSRGNQRGGRNQQRTSNRSGQ